MNDYDFFGVVPALDACEALGELLHAIIAGGLPSKKRFKSAKFR